MDNIVNMGQNDVMSNFTKTDDIMNDMRKIIEGSQKTSSRTKTLRTISLRTVCGTAENAVQQSSSDCLSDL